MTRTLNKSGWPNHLSEDFAQAGSRLAEGVSIRMPCPLCSAHYRDMDAEKIHVLEITKAAGRFDVRTVPYVPPSGDPEDCALDMQAGLNAAIPKANPYPEYPVMETV